MLEKVSGLAPEKQTEIAVAELTAALCDEDLSPEFLSQLLGDGMRRLGQIPLERLRQEMKFLLIGWVLMPDHFHLLLNPAERDRRNHSTDPEEAKRADGQPYSQNAS